MTVTISIQPADEEGGVFFVDESQTVCFKVQFPREVGRFHPFNFGGWLEYTQGQAPKCYVSAIDVRSDSVVPEGLVFGDISLLWNCGGVVRTPEQGRVEVVGLEGGETRHGVSLPDGSWLFLTQQPTFLRANEASYKQPPPERQQ